VIFFGVFLLIAEIRCIMQWTALHRACSYDYESIAMLLIEAKADVNAPDDWNVSDYYGSMCEN